MAYDRIPFYVMPEFGLTLSRIDNTTVGFKATDINKVLDDGRLIVKSGNTIESATLFTGDIIKLRELQVNSYSINVVDYLPQNFIVSSSNVFVEINAISKTQNIGFGVYGENISLKINEVINPVNETISLFPKQYNIEIIADEGYKISYAGSVNSPEADKVYDISIDGKTVELDSFNLSSDTVIDVETYLITNPDPEPEPDPDPEPEPDPDPEPDPVGETFNNLYLVDGSKVREIDNVSNDVWRLTLDCDVLETYKTDILNSVVNVTRTIKKGDYTQTNGETDVRKKIDIIKSNRTMQIENKMILSTIGG